MAWRIELAREAVRQLASLGTTDARRVTAFLRERVAEDPRRVGSALRGPLGDLWRYRVGDLRLICQIDDAVLRVLVVKIGHRREVYR